MIDPIAGIAALAIVVGVLAFWGWLHYKLGYYAGRMEELRKRRL